MAEETQKNVQQQDTSTNTLKSPQPVNEDTGNVISNEVVNNPVGTGDAKTQNESGHKFKVTSHDVVNVLFFSVGLAAFVLAIAYFRKRRSVLTSWQADMNDEINQLKGKVKSMQQSLKSGVKQSGDILQNELE